MNLGDPTRLPLGKSGPQVRAMASWEVRLHHSTDETSNDRGGKGAAERNSVKGMKQGPCTVMENLHGHRDVAKLDPASR